MATNIDGLAFVLKLRRLLFQILQTGDSVFAEERRLADKNFCPSIVAVTPPPVVEEKSLTCSSARFCSPRGGDDRGRQRMFALLLRRRGGRQKLVFAECRRRSTILVTRGLPSVSVPGLINHQRRHFFHQLDGAGVLDRARRIARPRPTPTMIDIGVARPSAHGQAMIRTATAFTIAWARRGSGPIQTQATKVRRR